MLGRTHQIIGITAGVGYYLAVSEPGYGPATFAAVLIASSFGSLLPDLDQPTAKIWDSIPYIGHTVGKASAPIFKHRSFMHSILGMLLVGWLISRLLQSFPEYWGINIFVVFVAFIIGYLAHLAADMFTVEGIPLFFPYHVMVGLPPKPFRGMRIMTGKWFENLVIFPLANILLIIILISHLAEIKLILFK